MSCSDSGSGSGTNNDISDEEKVRMFIETDNIDELERFLNSKSFSSGFLESVKDEAQRNGHTGAVKVLVRRIRKDSGNLTTQQDNDIVTEANDGKDIETELVEADEGEDSTPVTLDKPNSSIKRKGGQRATRRAREADNDDSEFSVSIQTDDGGRKVGKKDYRGDKYKYFQKYGNKANEGVILAAGDNDLNAVRFFFREIDCGANDPGKRALITAVKSNNLDVDF